MDLDSLDVRAFWEAAVAEVPDHPFLIWQDRPISYRDFDDRVNRAATVWSASHQRLWDAMNIDLGQLRGHVHHDATRWLRDAIDQARVERRLRENGQPLPPRNAVYIQALNGEIRLAERSVAHLAA